MIYNTTIISGSGNSWQGASGENLVAVGGQTLYAGKNVWTDGKIIYGYNIPSSLPKKVIKRKKKAVVPTLSYIPIYFYVYSDYCEITCLIPENYSLPSSQYEVTKRLEKPRNLQRLLEELQITTCEGYFSGENLYLIDGNTIIKWDRLNPITATNPSRGSIIDIGRNGGIFFNDFTFVNKQMEVFEISWNDVKEMILEKECKPTYIPEDPEEPKEYNGYITSSYTTKENVDDIGLFTARLAADIYFHDTEETKSFLYQLAVYDDGEFDLEDYSGLSKMGDGFSHEDDSMSFETDNGIITLEDYYNRRITVGKIYEFGKAAALSGELSNRYIYQYDNTGNLLATYRETVTNARLDAIDIDEKLADWGFTVIET